MAPGDRIRARAAKIGQRNTTARPRALATLSTTRVRQPRDTSAASASTRQPSAAPPSAAATSKGGLSDAAARARTGYGLDHWFEVLDRFGGVEKGHTASARHLHATHRVPGWYAQGITVAYERARGVRALNQRVDGDYEVSVSKVLTASTAVVVRAFSDRRARARWTRGVDAALVAALSASLDAPGAQPIVVRPDGQGRHRYRWDGTIVQLHLLPKAGGKVSVVVTNSRLAGPAAVEQRRARWRAALSALAEALSPPREI